MSKALDDALKVAEKSLINAKIAKLKPNLVGSAVSGSSSVIGNIFGPIWVKLAAYIALAIVILLILFGTGNIFSGGGRNGDDKEPAKSWLPAVTSTVAAIQAPFINTPSPTVPRGVEKDGRCDGIRKLEVFSIDPSRNPNKCISTVKVNN